MPSSLHWDANPATGHERGQAHILLSCIDAALALGTADIKPNPQVHHKNRKRQTSICYKYRQKNPPQITAHKSIMHHKQGSLHQKLSHSYSAY